MSTAIQIARQAPKLIEGLLVDMFAAKADDNRVCLGSVIAGQQHIQIQLVVTSNPATLMDDGNHDDDLDMGPTLEAQQGTLDAAWLRARADFIKAACDPETPRMSPAEYMALGAISALYWLALSQSDTTLAREIGNWWRDTHGHHDLGRVII